ncbi:Transmembrane amino acid transporter protein/Tryptophan/tyrosine permease family [Novymonas esmeraldas]|uniref:Transmembrane amino acid transporter protein/Tryptophan/tyrosine permease family n=1 Tax=Novymonas esmeraldas TaxID=1808958 RepID=A0AAW0EPD3_9TRYP
MSAGTDTAAHPPERDAVELQEPANTQSSGRPAPHVHRPARESRRIGLNENLVSNDISDLLCDGGSSPTKASKAIDADVVVDRSDQTAGEAADGSEIVAQQHSTSSVVRLLNRIVPSGGLLSGVFNLASFTLGAGIMSIPAAFNTSGMLLAIFYLLVVTVLTVFSITLLAQAMEKTGIYSFEGLARALFGRGGDIIVAVLMWLLCFGVAVGYVIALGDIFKPILHHPGVPDFLQKPSGDRLVRFGVWFFFMLPLVLPKRISSLRYVSAVGVLFIVLFVMCVVYHSIAYGLKDGIRDDLVMARPGNAAVSGLSIFCFSYLSQVNVGRIMVENTNSSVRKITMQAMLSCAMCGTLYLLTGFFGYAEFGPALEGNILDKYNPYQSPVFFVVFIGLIVKLCAAFSLNMLACRTALFQVVHWDVETMPIVEHTIVSVSFAVGALIVGLLVPDISLVFGLVGAFSGSFIGFVFPALFIMYCGNWNLKTVGIWYYLGTYFLLLCGVVAIVFGTGSCIYSGVIKYG